MATTPTKVMSRERRAPTRSACSGQRGALFSGGTKQTPPKAVSREEESVDTKYQVQGRLQGVRRLTSLRWMKAWPTRLSMFARLRRHALPSSESSLKRRSISLPITCARTPESDLGKIRIMLLWFRKDTASRLKPVWCRWCPVVHRFYITTWLWAKRRMAHTSLARTLVPPMPPLTRRASIMRHDHAT